MKILITGAGGFIAHNVLEWLYDNSEYNIIGSYRNRKLELEKVEMVQCDLFKNPEIIENIEFDAVIHFASQLYGNDIRDFLDNTVQATRNILDVSMKKKVKKFIYISSMSICGETRGVITEESERINLNDYEVTKWIGECLVDSAKIEEKVILRLPRLLGDGIDYSAPWIPKVSYSIMQNKDVYYYNPNSKYNAVMHTDDLARFICDILDGKVEEGIYILGADEEMSILEILEFLKEKLHSSSKLIEMEATKPDRCHLVDISKAKKAGFKADTVRHVLEKYVESMRRENGNESM